MTDPNEDRQFVERSRELFDDSVEKLDAATLSRLNRGRHAALEQLNNRRNAAIWSRWLPATGVVAAALVTVVVMRGPDAIDIAAEPVTASDFEMLLEEESLEMFEELEFYSWLESADLGANGDVG